MTTKRSRSETTRDQRDPRSDDGDFRADGSWNPAASKASRGPRFHFIARLCRARHAAHLSPAQIAEQIIASPFAPMFGETSQWLTLSSFRLWPLAFARTSADRTVIAAGTGSQTDLRWRDGLPYNEDAPFTPARGEDIAAFVDTLSSTLGVGGQ
jgi:hypothetical protein